jgi:leader peptidase (prepilin peptidase)/N-methyltransferase
MRYPLVEIATGLTSLLIYLKFGLSVEWAVYFAFSSSLIVLALIDAEHRILPDVITLNGIWVGILISTALGHSDGFASRLIHWATTNPVDPHWTGLASSVVGAIIGGGLLWAVGEAFFRIRGVEGMGFGDVKMMAMVGAFLGAPLTLLTIMIGSLVGSIIGLALIRFGGKSREYELPFGTFLGIAAIIAVLYGNDLIRFYIDRFIRPS